MKTPAWLQKKRANRRDATRREATRRDATRGNSDGVGVSSLSCHPTCVRSFFSLSAVRSTKELADANAVSTASQSKKLKIPRLSDAQTQPKCSFSLSVLVQQFGSILRDDIHSREKAFRLLISDASTYRRVANVNVKLESVVDSRGKIFILPGRNV